MRRSTALIVAGPLLLLFAAAPGLAQVDEGFSAQNFQAPIDPYGYVTLNGARSLRAGHPFFAAYIDWADDPLDLSDIREGVIEEMTFVHAVAAIGLLNIGDEGGLTAGVVVPYALNMEGFGRDPGTGTPDTVTPPRVDLPEDGRLADIRAELKLTLFDRSEALGVALRAWGTAPTGEDKFFLSNDERFGAGGGLVLEKELGFLRIGAEGGYEWLEGRTIISRRTFIDEEDGRERLLVIDDKLYLRAGLATELFVDDLWLVVEGHHQARANALWETTRESPIEVGAALRFDRHLLVLAGASAGLNNGVGAPDARVYASLGFAF